MYRHIYPVEAVLEKAFIGLELERFWHDAVGIRDHAIFGDDCVTFYSTGGHGLFLASAGYDPEHRSGQRAITQAKSRATEMGQARVRTNQSTWARPTAWLG
jgi:hypothetical protein